MNFNEAYLVAEEAHTVLLKYQCKCSFWRRCVYLSLFFTVLFAVLAFLIRLITKAYCLPVLLAGAMFPTTFFVCYSMYKMQFWADKAARQSIDVSLLNAQLCNIRNSESLQQNKIKEE